MKTMQTKHTPGPWTLSEVEKFQIISPAASQICECFTPFAKPRAVTSYEQVRANARLIAAAPELLAALRQVQEDCRSGSIDHSIYTIQQIDAALAKAIGV